MGTVKIGWSRREISTNEPVSIPGQAHLRISQGIMDPLYVTALCIDGGDGEDKVILCSCDIISLRGGVIQATMDKVKAMRPDIPVYAIVMNATHTHTSSTLSDTPEYSPDGVKIYPGKLFREFFTDMCAEAICEAWDTRTEGGIGYGYGYAVVGHSRRTVYFEDLNVENPAAVAPNGFGCMYGDTKKATFSHYEAGADHFLNALFTFDSNQKLTGMVVNVPCPSQVGERLSVLSADYWSNVRECVAKEYGESVYVLTQCAPAGDMAPRILHYNKAQKRRMRLKYGLDYDPEKLSLHAQDYMNKIMTERMDIAERIMDGLRDVYSWAKKDIKTELTVRHVSRVFPLQRRLITDEEKQWCEQNIEALRSMIPDDKNGTPEQIRVAVSRYQSVQGRNNRALARYEIQKQDPTLNMTIHAIQIGDIGMVTNRFELYHDYMHRIQARSPFLQTFCVQLAGDENSTYLATERGIANKGYSASLFCNLVGYEGGQQIVEGSLEMLNELNERQ